MLPFRTNWLATQRTIGASPSLERKKQTQMHVSLNELSTVSQKAALGVGASLGAAEDAAYAVRWLALRGFPALSLIRQGLFAVDTSVSVFGASGIEDGALVWRPRAEGKTLSSVLIGGAAAELFGSMETKRISFDQLDFPLIQLAHFAQLSVDRGIALHFEWIGPRSSMKLLCGDDTLRVVGKRGKPMPSEPCQVKVCQTAKAVSDSGETWACAPQAGRLYQEGCDVDDTDWREIRRLADRILVEASDRSRAVGAGAGLSDND